MPGHRPAKIEFKRVHAAYGPNLPLVLSGPSLTIDGGERLGIVGRTGSEKSSLALALIKILEIRSGSITVDGINIGGIAIHNLRSRVAVVPQDPVLFSGTIRRNLDPGGGSIVKWNFNHFCFK